MPLRVARYARLPLLVTRFADAGGRDWITQSPSRGDEHRLQERGLRQRRTSCDLIFCDEEGRGDYLQRWLEFRAAAEGPAALFDHPLDGSYLAVVADLQGEVSLPERAVRVTCTFVAAEQPSAQVQPVGAGVAVPAGAESVDVAAAAAEVELDALGLSSSAPAACRSAAQAWAAAEAPIARSIAVEAASLAADLDDLVQTGELLVNLERWEAYRAIVLLRSEVARAAAAATSSAAQVYAYTLQVAEPLLSLAARLYGATRARQVAEQMARDNAVRTPGLVPAGTTLLLPVVDR